MNILYNFNTTDASHPSFFEMFIQTQMMPSLKPALKYVLAVLSQKYPRIEGSLKWADEIFYGALFVIERHYLKNYDGSFSENFYGLRRAPVTVDGKAPPPTRAQKQASLFFLVIVPYLKDKLDQYYARRFGGGHEHDFGYSAAYYVARDQANQSRLWKFLLVLFKKFYPALSAIYEGIFFVYQLLYMYNHTVFYTPFLHLQGLTVKRVSAHDLMQQSQREATKKMLRSNLGLLKTLLLSFSDAGHKLLDFFKYLLPTTIFVFKFLEWWYSENRLSTNAEPIPPPPDAPKKSSGGAVVPKDKTICPLCNNKRTNPAMSVGGFVFCYPCLFNHVQMHNKCPVTLLPMSTDQIRKIYDEDRG
eukprot:TRINITY_DN2175_c0_g1_i1.p1 TRINITY_DN2175_c0_g1~~TRINITY_DN2175_c0_g1_i1.p1  ORF type:complete len:359 (+),score=52.42 TRINITY_DN2175_c0_g1_i1:69-1145(+)